MLLGYNFGPTPTSRALGTTGSVMTIGLSISERMLAPEKPV